MISHNLLSERGGRCDGPRPRILLEHCQRHATGSERPNQVSNPSSRQRHLRKRQTNELLRVLNVCGVHSVASILRLSAVGVPAGAV
jgi:hypothetical protein